MTNVGIEGLIRFPLLTWQRARRRAWYSIVPIYNYFASIQFDISPQFRLIAHFLDIAQVPPTVTPDRYYVIVVGDTKPE